MCVGVCIFVYVWCECILWSAHMHLGLSLRVAVLCWQVVAAFKILTSDHQVKALLVNIFGAAHAL